MAKARQWGPGSGRTEECGTAACPDVIEQTLENSMKICILELDEAALPVYFFNTAEPHQALVSSSVNWQ